MKLFMTLLATMVAIHPAASAENSAASFSDSAAYGEFRRAGFSVVDERMMDLDGDGLLDALVLERTLVGIGLSAWKALDDDSFKFLSRAPQVPANLVARFDLIDLHDKDRAWLLDLAEDSPDEADHRVRLFLIQPTGLKQVFEASYRVTHPEEEAGRKAMPISDFGQRKAGLEILPQKNAWPRLRVRQDPKTISLSEHSGRYVIGAREALYQARAGSYQVQQDSYHDFMTKALPDSVTATSHLPSVEAIFRAKSAADGDLASAWVEGASGAGAGESITLSFKRKVPVRMVRIVPGCAQSIEAWQAHNRLSHFSLQFENGILLHLGPPGSDDLDPALADRGEFSLPGRDYGRQILVFLAKPVKSAWVKLTIEQTSPGNSENNETCLAEISVHQALVDEPKQ